MVRDDKTTTRHLLLEPYEDVVIYPGMERSVVSLLQLRMALSGGIDVLLDITLHALGMQPIRGSARLHAAAGEDPASVMRRSVVIGDEG
jgi:hypothetical protein